MESIQFSPVHAGLLTRLSKFLKSCAPYSITAPGYSIIYATTNVYRAWGRVVTQNALADLPSKTVEGFHRRKEALLNFLNVGDRRDKWFTTLYEGKNRDFVRNIRHSRVAQNLLCGLCTTLSLVATMLCVVKTIVLCTLAITVCAALLPLVPLFFLLCTTVAVERHAVARVRVAFRTSVREGISDCIKKNLSFGHDRERVGKQQDHRGTSLEDLARSTRDLNGSTSVFVSMVSSVLSTLGEVIALAVCVPIFMLVAPISLMVSGSLLLLSLCSLSKSTISRNVETMGYYAVNDFLPLTAKARDDMQAYGSLEELDKPTREFGNVASSLSSIYFDEEVDPLLTTTPPSSWSSRTKLSRENSVDRGRTLNV